MTKSADPQHTEHHADGLGREALVPGAVTEYRVRETQTVTDDSLSRILNEETRKGWIFDGMTFVPNEASKRPKMAFLIFTRERPPHAQEHALPSPRTTVSGHEP